MDLQVVNISEQEFASLRDDWARLQEHSRADSLFMSWPWLYSWWEVWGERLSLEPLILGVYNADGRLVGLAPLYRHRFRTALGIRIARLHFMGNAWRVSPTVRTEYVGLIAERGGEQAVARVVYDYLKLLDWDELVISDCQEADAGDLGKALSGDGGVTPILRNESQGVCIDTTGDFSAWISDLGPNTRLKAFNRRKVFAEELGGDWQICEDTEQGRTEFLKKLNRFHELRWGKPCFDEQAVLFHSKLLSRLSGGQRPLLSRLKIGEDVVSLLYDVQSGKRVYNLQSGYEEHWHSKLSLGTLHLGYAIEHGFSCPDIERYDLLAGAGKNTFYKARFKGEKVIFPTLDFVRSPILRAAYRCRSWMPQGWVSRINRVFRL